MSIFPSTADDHHSRANVPQDRLGAEPDRLDLNMAKLGLNLSHTLDYDFIEDEIAPALAPEAFRQWAVRHGQVPSRCLWS
ncbi:hypothetical protein [Microtetraspora niveoalba]|uniref:hypothetical protein n=1 Tax=Microtetraspora niveoalba TaxID=46175 RepID=UPI0012FA766B|nr:hypothetical protein [Microtetraspora niveoalba]